MRFSTILFDLDDTLMPEHAADRAALRAVVDTLSAGVDIDCDALFESVGAASRELLGSSPFHRHAVDVGLSAVEVLWSPSDPFEGLVGGLEEWVHPFRLKAWQIALANDGGADPAWAEEITTRYAAERDLHHAPYPESLEVLAELQSLRPLGLVTNGAPVVQRRKAAAAGLLPFFDALVVSGDIGSRKPEPVVFERALAMLGVPPEEAVMIGDRMNTDIEGAKSAGITAILVNRSGRNLDSQNTRVRPDATIADLTGLIEVLRSL